MRKEDLSVFIKSAARCEPPIPQTTNLFAGFKLTAFSITGSYSNCLAKFRIASRIITLFLKLPHILRAWKHHAILIQRDKRTIFPRWRAAGINLFRDGLNLWRYT